MPTPIIKSNPRAVCFPLPHILSKLERQTVRSGDLATFWFFWAVRPGYFYAWLPSQNAFHPPALLASLGWEPFMSLVTTGIPAALHPLSACLSTPFPSFPPLLRLSLKFPVFPKAKRSPAPFLALSRARSHLSIIPFSPHPLFFCKGFGGTGCFPPAFSS